MEKCRPYGFNMNNANDVGFSMQIVGLDYVVEVYTSVTPVGNERRLVLRFQHEQC